MNVFAFLASWLFVAAGIGILLSGKDPGTGCLTVVFFGGCGLIAAWELFGRFRNHSDQRGCPHAFPPAQRVVLKHRRGECAVYCLGSAGLATGGAWMMLSGKGPVTGWISLLFFGLGTLVLLWRFLDPRARLILDVQGVYDRNLGVGWIAWSDITATWRLAVHEHDFLGLGLRDPDKYLSRLSRWRRFIARGNRWWGCPELYLCLSGLTLSPDQVERLIAWHLNHARATTQSVSALCDPQP